MELGEKAPSSKLRELVAFHGSDVNAVARKAYPIIAEQEIAGFSKKFPVLAKQLSEKGAQEKPYFLNIAHALGLGTAEGILKQGFKLDDLKNVSKKDTGFFLKHTSQENIKIFRDLGFGNLHARKLAPFIGLYGKELVVKTIKEFKERKYPLD
ncbi:MAG: hypothetical protein V1847_03535, partial [Candidatus Diapherotrites archaeon]